MEHKLSTMVVNLSFVQFLDRVLLFLSISIFLPIRKY